MALAEKWRPCGLLNQKPTTPYAVIVLNQPVNKNALNAVISTASLLVCADGGADRLLAYEQQTGTTATGSAPNGSSNDNNSHKGQYRHRLPDAIIGDLDSLSRRAEEHYRERGVLVVKDPDQYSTDFTKCLSWIRGTMGDAPMDVVVLGGLGGRVDQGFSQIHHLFMAENDPSLLRGRIYLLSEQSLSFVLANGQNLVYVEPGYFAENIGIIPVLGKTLLTTKGLEWDVENWPTEFGGQVSTSNHIRSDVIEIAFEGPRPLLTLELDARLSASGE
ncbi:hypothetical protein LTR84_005075 [Exophiala bonariae]|uniref:Thiamine pyrophosphokinase n=1 Tax=Exophiala bonariae TaxID=1690606 RepID=A0AAV9NRE9_9EURO|nr:hypothetical protein LTR84_005075 [Exophiala bonariae]